MDWIGLDWIGLENKVGFNDRNVQ